MKKKNSAEANVKTQYLEKNSHTWNLTGKTSLFDVTVLYTSY